jgi:hypothetical protein
MARSILYLIRLMSVLSRFSQSRSGRLMGFRMGWMVGEPR